MNGDVAPADEDADEDESCRLQSGRPFGKIYYGVCSWTDKTLTAGGTFYPADVKSAEARLRFYASRFPLVEVDSTYYAPPSVHNARLWAERTPPGFLFNVKVHALLTHHPADVQRLPLPVREMLPSAVREKRRAYLREMPLQVVAAIWSLHVEALRPLADAGKLGCVLFQFPPWFRATRGAADYLRQLRDRLPYRIAVEFRGGGWMDEERRGRTLALLEALGYAYVAVDEPQGFRSSTPPIAACTAPLAIVRFHGRNTETYEKKGISVAERFRYLYAEEELREWVAPIQALAETADQVHVLMNNCHGDDGIRNAWQLAGLLAAAS